MDSLIADNQAKLDRVLDLYICGNFAKEMLTERKHRLEEIIFYYVFLKLLIDWPASLLGWDLLFLIPLPWWSRCWCQH